MKKIMKMMAMALVAVAMTVGFAACSSSDDDNNGGGSSQSLVGKLNMNLTFSDDLLAIADIQITYTESDGQTKKTENITTNTFKKEITYNSLPVATSYTLQITKKSSYTEKEKYNLSIQNGSSISSTRGDGTINGLKENNKSVTTSGVKNENLDDFFANKAWTGLGLSCTISKDGKVQ